MGMTAVEEVLARAAGKHSVSPGDVIYPDPDFIMIHDGLVRGAKRELDALGINRLAAPEKVIMVTDHEVIYGSARAAEFGVINRNAANCTVSPQREIQYQKILSVIGKNPFL